jgi:hypothetical protein
MYTQKVIKNPEFVVAEDMCGEVSIYIAPQQRRTEDEETDPSEAPSVLTRKLFDLHALRH